jgi:hypothetical protein
LNQFWQPIADFYRKSGRTEEVKAQLMTPPREKGASHRLAKKAVVTALIGIAVLLAFIVYERALNKPVSTVKNPRIQPAVFGDREPASALRTPLERPVPSALDLNVNLPPLNRPNLKPDLKEPALTLAIEAVEPTWVMAEVDDLSVKEVLLQPGEKVLWKAEKKFDLTLGNAGGVRLQVNGKPMDPLGPSGMVVRNIILTR